MRQPLVAFPPNIKLPYALLKGRGVEGWPCLGQLFDHHGFPDAGSSQQPAVQPWASGGGAKPVTLYHSVASFLATQLAPATASLLNRKATDSRQLQRCATPLLQLL